MTEAGSSSLLRAMAILDALGAAASEERTGLGVVEVARLIGREKSQVSRTLRVLADGGYVDRDPETLEYRIGWRVFALASSAADQRLRAVAPQVLREVVALVGERVYMTVLIGTDVITVMSEGPARIIQASNWVGRATPLHNTSAGRALMFDHDDDEIRKLVAGAPFGNALPNGPRDVEDLLRRLRVARKHGYVVLDEEFEVGHVAVAAPVRDFRGRTIAALNISGPKFRLGRHLKPVGEQVMAAANRLSHLLTDDGASLPPYPNPQPAEPNARNGRSRPASPAKPVSKSPRRNP